VKKDAPRIRYFNMGAWPVYVGFTSSDKAFQAEMKRLAVEEPGKFLSRAGANATTHYLDNDGTLTCIITIGCTKGGSKSQVAALIAHEAVHVVQEMWSHLGETNPGREQEAYLVQQITQECLQELWSPRSERRTEPVA
jgi:hypothetical protein